ncbi:MAG: hypothetical protein PHW76_04145 [Alphaproteobacteria bacterium]|nr:hypothetical protein [Alphaproteobacteria bacterium]
MDFDVIFLLSGAAFVAVSAIAFSAIFWLRKLRDVFLTTLREMAGHQVRTVQRLSEAIDQLQKQQNLATRQIQALAQEGLRLQKEITVLARNLESAQEEPKRARQTLH